MSAKFMNFPQVEPLEARIAPAALLPTIIDAENDPTGSHFKTTTVGTPIVLNAGDVLTTGAAPKSGSYLMFVEQGQALIFTTDLNQNGFVDFNEITGIAAGDGLRLISFVDIHGDIVTNLKSNGTLSDSDNNGDNDNLGLKGDGRVLLNNRIEKIELRSVRTTDLTDQNGDGVVDIVDQGLRVVISSYSIFGQIIAGAGFGVEGDATSGLIIDDRGKAVQQTFFPGPIVGSPFGPDYFDPAVTPITAMIGGIVVGSAASDEYFSFGLARNSVNDPLGTGIGGDLANGNDVQGTLKTFIPASGAEGGGIFYVRGFDPTVAFNIGKLLAGDGGARARGGSIENVTLNGDTAGGYIVQAGDGGSGPTGGTGGSVLDFQDLGSNTSELIVQSGNGGVGTTGAGGAGGGTTFGTMNILGNVKIIEGDGGTGFTAGGSGASLTKAVITAPDRLEDFARNIVGTTHDTPHDPVTGRRIIVDPLAPGVIGQGNAVDFDGDGFGDIVFTSSNPSQLVVQFGDGFGGFRLKSDGSGFPDRFYLDGPIDAEALTIGDLDGDGHYDIATGSRSGGSHAGIFVFLSKYEDGNGDGVLSKSEDLDGDSFNDLVGFRTARFSPMPNIDGNTRSGHTMSDIEAGDFNGDGFTDLAVAATYYGGTNGLQPFQLLFFMYSDVEDGKPTGQFYADFGSKGQAIPPIPASPRTPWVQLSGPGDTTVNIEVTALNRFADHDVVVSLADTGARSRGLRVWDNSIANASFPVLFGPIPLGQVDTNRALLAGGNANISLTNAFGLDFAIVDFDQDGNADFSVLIEQPAGFLISLQGDGIGGARRIDIPVNGNQNAGFFFGPPANGNGGANITTNLQAIVGTDADGDGLRDEVAILYYGGTPPGSNVIEMEIGFPPTNTPPQPAQFTPTVGRSDNPGATRDDIFGISAANDTAIVAFDAFYPRVNSPLTNYAVGEQETGQFTNLLGRNLIISAGNVGFDFVVNAEHNLFLVAGDGGTGIVGRGGSGGDLGSDPINRNTLTGSIDIRVDFGFLQMRGGQGGNGFSGGGSGGSITGTVFDSASGSSAKNLINAQLTAGNGGLAVSGSGGAGGNLIGNSILFGTTLTAGSGGDGLAGGNGGTIVGNGIPGLYDSADLILFLFAGSGGNGIKRGGTGGDIRNFHASFDINSSDELGGILYLGGNGGSAVTGAGGNGGSVINTSPIEDDRNQLAGDIYMAGGRGGNGRIGGHGGSVDTFSNTTDQFQVPAILSFLGGDGGNGTKGRAGNGGSVKNISTASSGAPNVNAGSISNFFFNRLIAGRGGDSAGSNGGNGGSVTNINVTAQDNPLALVGGAGGDGLFRGGNGGGVNGASIQIGNTSFAKAVIIAGEGGDANAYLSNANDPAALKTVVKAFGGRIGKGGNGGSISGVNQLGGILARIDLIAGSGGDTVNYGTVVDLSHFVGKGGSISNVHADGSIGNIDPLVPIRSYNDIRTGETMDDFVTANLRNEASPGSVDDTVGNVGLVTGAAGRIKAVFNGYKDSHEASFPSIPVAKGINGSLKTITARNIMSAVAGNVERIAAIQSVKDIHLTSGGALGADKLPGIAGDPRFQDANGNPSPAPVLDGILIDGAMVTRALPTDLAGRRLVLGPDVYILA